MSVSGDKSGDKSSGKVITALRDRLEIEQEIQAMLKARSEDDFSRQARRVAARGNQVIPVIVNGLENSDSRLLGALGTVASLYPEREQILNKLYQIAADVERSDKSRLSAMLIMERFLDQEPDLYLVGTLSDPRLMAIQSIQELLREGKRKPGVLIDYVRALSGQPPETFYEVIDTLLEVGGEAAVPALCLLSQEQDDALAAAALVALGRLSHPRAASGLQSIRTMLPPDRRPLCDRQLLKLRMKGIAIAPLPAQDERWRALVSPLDVEGSRAVWMVSAPDENDDCAFIGVSISEGQGIVRAYGRHRAAARLLPDRRPTGHLHTVSLGQPAADPTEQDREGLLLHMLEADPDYGRRLMRQGQSLCLEQGRMLPIEYRLLGRLVWQSDDAGIDASLPPPVVADQGPGRLKETLRLFSHPGFRGWSARGEAVLEHTRAMLRWMPVLFLEGVSSEAVALAQEYFDRATLDLLQHRLEAMVEWLQRAQEAELAELAALAASTLHAVPPAEHPFTLHMAELGLNLFVEQVKTQVRSDQ